MDIMERVLDSLKPSKDLSDLSEYVPNVFLFQERDQNWKRPMALASSEELAK